MKKIIVISDSFKGTLSSQEICAIAKTSVPKIIPGCEVVAIASGQERDVEVFVDLSEKLLGAKAGTMDFVRALIRREGGK